MPTSPFNASDHPSDKSTATSTNDLIIELHTPVTPQILSKTSVTSETDTVTGESSDSSHRQSPQSQVHDDSGSSAIEDKCKRKDSRHSSCRDNAPCVSSSQATCVTSTVSVDSEQCANKSDHETLESSGKERRSREDKASPNYTNEMKNEMKSQSETAVHAAADTLRAAVFLSSTPPDSTVIHSTCPISSSPSVTSSPLDTKMKQVEQLQRFLNTLQTFANDLSPEISHAIRSLVIALSTSSITVDDFVHRVQEVTQYPLRSYVLPFLRIHVPVYQDELQRVTSKYATSVYTLLSKSHTSPFDCVKLLDTLDDNPKSKQSNATRDNLTQLNSKHSRSSPVEAFEIFLPRLPLPSVISSKSCREGAFLSLSPNHSAPVSQVSSVSSCLSTSATSVFTTNAPSINSHAPCDITRLNNNNYYPSILSHLSLHHLNANQHNYFKSPRLLANSSSHNSIPLNMGIKDLPVKRRLSSPPDSRKENELHPPTSAKRSVISATVNTQRNHSVTGFTSSVDSNQLNHSSHNQVSGPSYHSSAASHSSTGKHNSSQATVATCGTMIKQTTATNTTSMNCNDHHHPRQGNILTSKCAGGTSDKLISASSCHLSLRKEAPETDQEWQNIHTMLNCIRGMVDKTMKAIAILQMRSMEQTNPLSLVTANSRNGTCAPAATCANSTSASALPSNGKIANTSDQGCSVYTSSPSSSSASMTASSASQHMITCAVSSLATAGHTSLFLSSPSLVQHPYHQRGNHVTVPSAASAVTGAAASPSSSTCSPSSSLSSSSSSSAPSLSPSPPSSSVTGNYSSHPSTGQLLHHSTVHHSLAGASSAVQLMKLASGVKQSNVNSNNCISSSANNGLLSLSPNHAHLADSSVLKDKSVGHLRPPTSCTLADAAFEAKRLTVHKTTADSNGNSSSTSGVGGATGLSGGGSTTVNASDLIERAKLELMLSQAMMRRQAVAAAAFAAREDPLLAPSAAPTSGAFATVTVASENCWNCGREANETCSGCSVAKYCSYFCQHKDWESHHKMCGVSLYAETNQRIAGNKVTDLTSHKQSPGTSHTASVKSFHRASSPFSVKSPFDHSKVLRSHSPDLPVVKSTSPLTSAKTHSPSPLQLSNE